MSTTNTTAATATTSTTMTGPYSDLSPKEVHVSGHACVCAWEECRKYQLIFAAHRKFRDPTEIRAGNCLNLKFTSKAKSSKFSHIVQTQLQARPFPVDKPIYVARHHWSWRQLQRFDAGKRPSTTVSSKAEIEKLSAVVDEDASWEVEGKKEYFMAPNVSKEAVAYAIDCILASAEQAGSDGRTNIGVRNASSENPPADVLKIDQEWSKPASNYNPTEEATKKENERLSEENRQLREEIDRLSERLKNQELVSDTDFQNFVMETFDSNDRNDTTFSHLLGTVGSTAMDDFALKNDNTASPVSAPAFATSNSTCTAGPMKRQKTASASAAGDLSCTMPMLTSSSSFSDDSSLSPASQSLQLPEGISADLKPEEAAVMENMNIADLDLESDLLPFGTGAA